MPDAASQYLERFGYDAGAAAKILPDGRIAFLYRLLFTYALCVGRLDNGFGYDDRWCYRSQADAQRALADWNGVGEPAGWHRHPATDRRR